LPSKLKPSQSLRQLSSSPSSSSPPDLSQWSPSTHRASPPVSSDWLFLPLLSTWRCDPFPANVATKKNYIIMDPLGDPPPPRAFFPSSVPLANAPPPAPAAAFLSGPKTSFRATSTTLIGIFTLRRLTFPRGTTWLLVTLLPSTNAPILQPFKSLILRGLFAHSPRSLLPSFDGEESFSFLPQPLLLLPPTGRRLLPSRCL
jgi:hypothetical protein